MEQLPKFAGSIFNPYSLTPLNAKYPPNKIKASKFESMNAPVTVLLPMAGMKSRATMAVATNNEANTPQGAMGFGIKFDFKNR